MSDGLIAKYRSLSVQAKAAIWFVVCSILQKGIAFITVPIFTRLLTAEEYGIYSLYLSWLQILTIITSLYLYYGVFNNGMTKYEEDRDRYISSMQGLTTLLTAIVLAVYLAAIKLWNGLLGLTSILVILMFIEMLVTPAFYFWSGRQRFEYKYKKLVAVTLCKSILNPIVGLVAVWFANDKATARVFSVVIVEFVFCGTIMIYQFIKGKCFINKHYWLYALGLAIPLIPHYLSSMILGQGDRIMISKMVGTAEVAFYSVAYSIGMLVQIFTTAMANSFTPWFYQKLKSRNYSGISSTIDLLLLLIAAIIFVLMLCSPELVRIFGSAEYTGASYVIPPVAASVFFIFLYNILATPQFYFEKTQFLLFSSLAAAVLNIILNYFFISIFGYIAAGYTTLICYVLYSFGHYIVSKRVMHKYITDGRLFDARVILFLSVIVILAGVFCNFIFQWWYIRYGIIVIAFIILIVKRKVFLDLIMSLRENSDRSENSPST